MGKIHHTAICVSDLEASLVFWRDGLGLQPFMDREFDGDWPTLFGVDSTHLHAIFLGDPTDPDAGIIELIVVGDGNPSWTGPPKPSSAQGFFLVSLYVDHDIVLPRLAELDVEVRSIEVSGVRLAVAIDPDGIMVELMDHNARRNLATITDR